LKFIGGGNCSTWRKPVTCAFKPPAKFITTSVVMGTDGTGSCKSNYLTITMTPPILNRKTIIKILSPTLNMKKWMSNWKLFYVLTNHEHFCFSLIQ
jgi:hypothetical protein